MNPNWDEAPEFGRRETLLRTLRRLWELHPDPVCIVETGTLRNDSPSGRDGDGWSTVAWGWYCSQVGGRAYTVDVDEGHLAVCRRVTAPYAGALEYVASDSVAFLRRWREEDRGPIHLLYLDSVDYFDSQRAESEEHHQGEAEAALPSLAVPAWVLIDDTRPTGGSAADGCPVYDGKGTRAVPFLLKNGFRIAWSEGGQVLLER